jgi:hypothetical protein
LADDAVDTDALQDDCVTDAKCGFTNVQATSGTFTAGLTAQTFTASSDRNLKQEIRQLNPDWCLRKVNEFEPCSYQFKGSEERRTGVIAQQIDGVAECDHLVKYDMRGMLSVNYTDMTAHLLGAVQALTQKCRWLESRLDNNTDMADVSRLPSSMVAQLEKNRDNMHIE